MKSVVAPYATRAFCLRIECLNGAVFRLTRYPYDIAMSNGAVYVSAAGADFSSYESNATFAPSAVDLEGFIGLAGITRDLVASGVFDNGRANLFACNFLAPVEDYEPLVCSLLGKTTLDDATYKIEEMALIDLLGQNAGLTYAVPCSRRFGDAGCTVGLGAITASGTLTAVTSASVFRDAARGEAADHYAGGTLVFTSGVNVGLKALEIRSYAADGTITLYSPAYYTPAIGDAYQITPGCRKTLAACKAHQGHVLNHFGFPDVPTTSVYAQVGSK